jgi:septum formation protein
MPQIILASQSPRRKELMQLAEIPFEVVVANTDESYPSGLSYTDTAIHIAHHKAIAVAQKCDKDSIIIAADTIVICNGKIIGKPEDKHDAINILSLLSGNVHEVVTGVTILYKEKIISFADTTKVSFHNLTKAQIEYYIEKYKPYDKAGAYAIQEWIGAVGIKKIEGDFYNVMGLPISMVSQKINEIIANDKAGE